MPDASHAPAPPKRAYDPHVCPKCKTPLWKGCEHMVRTVPVEIRRIAESQQGEES